MEFEELVGVVWDCLSQATSSLTSKEVALKAGQSLPNVQSALSRLRQDDIVHQLVNKEGLPVYMVKLELSAIEWAQAVSLGVSIFSLEKHASLKDNVYSSVCEVVDDGSLEKFQNKKKEDKKRSRDVLLKGRAASQTAALDLEEIIKDTGNALSSGRKGVKSEEDEQVLAILKEAQESAIKAYDSLIQKLSGVNSNGER